MATHKPHTPHPSHDVEGEDPEPGMLPVDPDQGPVPPVIPLDPEHERIVDPEARRAGQQQVAGCGAAAARIRTATASLPGAGARRGCPR